MTTFWPSEPAALGVTEGVLLGGRYELGAVLGRGGMGEVRSARDQRLSRAVAVKVLHPHLAAQPGVRRRFEAEARSAARLSHPHVVAVHDVGEEDGLPYIVMELVSGPTLEQEMRPSPLDPERARRLAGEILTALGAAHAVGLVHRDVKPGNVLLGPDGAAKVTDFGIAKSTGSDTATAGVDDPTGTGQVMGTVAYMAPERLTGQPATVQSDLYSVAIVLYEMLSGARPFAADTPVGLALAIHNDDPVPLAQRCAQLDPSLVAIVDRGMARRPEDRFASAAEMAAALRSVDPGPGAVADNDLTVAIGRLTVPLPASPGPSSAPGVSSLEPPPPPPWGRIVAVILALAAAAGVVAGTGAGHKAQPPTGATATTQQGSPAGPTPLDDAIKRLEERVR
jgi:serine/threonine-protein kinase